MKVKSEAQFFFAIYILSRRICPENASDKPTPAGEALKKARTTEIPQDSCCPSLGWVKSAPIGSVRAADSACGKILGLSLAE